MPSHKCSFGSYAARRLLGVSLPSRLFSTFALSSPAQSGGENASRLRRKRSDSPQPRMEAAPTAGMLDSGFRNLYELDFKGGREQFLSYQKLQPNDPLGKAAEAASYLYEQFNAKGIFTSDFFLSDDKFLGGAHGTPAENRNDAFLNANHMARRNGHGAAESRSSPITRACWCSP